MFKTSTTVPILKSGKNFAIIIAIPVNPPGTMPLGSRKRLIATAYITEPMHIKRYFNAMVLILAFIKITMPLNLKGIPFIRFKEIMRGIIAVRQYSGKDLKCAD